MNRHLASLVISLALITTQSFAREPQAPLRPSANDGSTKVGTVRPNPEPDNTQLGYVDYVGNFGEVFKLHAGEVIDASMHGPIEVINLYPDRMVFRPGGYEQFKPKPKDFSPENFSRLEIIQLLIIPRAADAYHSLDTLKAAKIKDLRSSGVEFEVIEDPFFGPPTGQWPTGTFEIYVSSPYRLTQLYTATASYLCILTSGLDTPPSTAIDMYSRALRYGLAEWLVPENGPEEKTTPRDIWANGISLHPFTLPIVWVSWAAVSGISCFLAWFLGIKKRWDSLRRACLSLLIFSNVGALLGGLIGLVFWPFDWFAHHIPAAAMIACGFIPAIAFIFGRARALKASARAQIGTAIWAAVAAAFLAYYSTFDSGSISRYVPSYTVILSFITFGIAGIIFGTLDSRQKISAKILLLAILFLPAFASRSRAQQGEALSRASLKTNDAASLRIRREAIVNLRKTGNYFDFQRVEMKGIWSPGEAGSDNDTNDHFRLMFDKQIAPSSLAKTDKTKKMPVWMQNTINGGKDLKDLNKEAYNQLSGAAIRAVKELEGKEINELVAHSWGTEIIYNAILAGKILPPRRLLVAGMPDHDLEKWNALSKYTGTEVVVYTNTNDPIAGGPRVIGATIEAAKIGADAIAKTGTGYAGRIDTAPSIALFDQQWASMCREPRVCNPHHRSPPKTEYKSDFKDITHDRHEYFQAMVDNNDLPAPPVEMTLFPPAEAPTPYPGSAPALQALQNEKLDLEIRRVTDELAAKARAQIEIAHRDHDERLRKIYAAAAKRSCTNPGSVTQAELNRLPEPYNKDMIGTMPYGLTPCESQVYLSLGNGVDAGEIRKMSEPQVALDANPEPQIAPKNVVQDVNFLQMLPRVKNFAVASCQSPGQIPLTDITRHNSTIRFSPEADEEAADRLAAGLGFCEDFLFRRLMGVIRFGNPHNITQQWVADIVRAHAPVKLTPQTPQAPQAPAPQSVSSRQIDPPSYLGRPCESYGNKRCP